MSQEYEQLLSQKDQFIQDLVSQNKDLEKKIFETDLKLNELENKKKTQIKIMNQKVINPLLKIKRYKYKMKNKMI